MRVRHEKPWAYPDDTNEEGVVQPSTVVQMDHVVDIDYEDLFGGEAYGVGTLMVTVPVAAVQDKTTWRTGAYIMCDGGSSTAASIQCHKYELVGTSVEYRPAGEVWKVLSVSAFGTYTLALLVRVQ